MNIILFSNQLELCRAWETAFKGCEDVKILHDDFYNIATSYAIDCIVSPANSYGLMDGGFDGVLTKYFGNQLMERVQRDIIRTYWGEQPIGTSSIIVTHNDKIPYIAHSPTMKYPMVIRNTDNCYQATKAVFKSVKDFNMYNYMQNPIKTLAFTGMGTGTGQLPFNAAAKQMRMAYNDMKKPPDQIDWAYVNDQRDRVHNSLYDY